MRLILNEQEQDDISEVVNDYASDIPHLCICCMEELAESAQQVGKLGRNKLNRDSLIEEFADVFYNMAVIMQVVQMTDEELTKIFDLKRNRYKERKKTGQNN